MMITGEPITKPTVQCAHCGGVRTKRLAVVVDVQSDLVDFECRDCGQTTRVKWLDFERTQKEMGETNQA
jgi:hypothetical protein